MSPRPDHHADELAALRAANADLAGQVTMLRAALADAQAQWTATAQQRDAIAEQSRGLAKSLEGSQSALAVAQEELERLREDKSHWDANLLFLESQIKPSPFADAGGASSG